MIFLDSNVPMYLVGADHPNKRRAQEILERLIGARERLLTSVEVYQEILHRYTSINRREAIGPAWDLLTELVDDVLTLNMGDVVLARDLVVEHTEVSARDAIHAAVMRRHEVPRILTFDTGFDAISGVTRIS